jgi:3-mercaptopyruvate sulfurtransferase SseA
MRWTSLRALLVALAVTTGTTLPAGAEGDLAAVPRISLTEFKKLHDQDKAMVIDTRSAESYRGGHIPGAINVPLSAWNDHLPRLKATRKPIVAYCA